MKSIKLKRIIFLVLFILVIILLNLFSILYASPILNSNQNNDFLLAYTLLIFSTLIVILFNDIFNPIQRKKLNIIVKLFFYFELIYIFLLNQNLIGYSVPYFQGFEFFVVLELVVMYSINIIGGIALSISYYKKK